MSVIAYFRITRDRAKTILAEVEHATWRDEGRAMGMTADELDAFIKAFEHGERAAAKRAIG